MDGAAAFAEKIRDKEIRDGEMSKANNGRMLLGSLALLAMIWGVLGWFDLDSQAEAGFDTDTKQQVIEVQPDSAAAEAGLLRGDQILSIAGFAAEDTRSLALLPRMKPGDRRVFTVSRDGVEQEIAIIYAPLTPAKLALERAAAVIGFCFLLFPMLALFRVSNAATRMLTVMGIGLSMAFLHGPFVSDASIRAMTATISTLFMLFGIAAMLQFLLMLPNWRPFLDKSWARVAIYLPAFSLWLLLAWRLLFNPPATAALNMLTGLLVGIVVGAYLLLALFRILRNYSQTDSEQRERLGLNLMLWGTVIGLLPATLALLVTTFSPHSVLPGQDYYFMSLALIPLTWARSASRS